MILLPRCNRARENPNVASTKRNIPKKPKSSMFEGAAVNRFEPSTSSNVMAGFHWLDPIDRPHLLPPALKQRMGLPESLTASVRPVGAITV